MLLRELLMESIVERVIICMLLQLHTQILNIPKTCLFCDSEQLVGSLETIF